MQAKQSKLLKWFFIFKNRFIQAEVGSSSVIIAYYLLLSLFPLFIAMGNLLSLFKINPQVVLAHLNVIVPPPVQDVLNPVIENLLTGGSGGLFSLSAIGLIWAASRGITYLQKCMNKAYGVVPQNGLLVKKGVSLVMVLLLLVLMVAFVLVFSVGQMVLELLAENFLWAGQLGAYLNQFKWPASILVIFTVLVWVYCVIPDVKLRLRDVWPGSLVGVAGLLVLAQLFTVYLQFSVAGFSSYDALGAFIALMLWLNFSSVIVLCGSILNAALYEYKYGKATPQSSKLDVYLRGKSKVLRDKATKRRNCK